MARAGRTVLCSKLVSRRDYHGPPGMQIPANSGRARHRFRKDQNGQDRTNKS